MSYAQAFQPLLSLLGQRVEAQQQASLLKAQTMASEKAKTEQRTYDAGLLKRREEIEAPERALKLFAGGMRPYAPGAMRAEDTLAVDTMRAGGGLGGTTGLLVRSVAPVVQQRATEGAAADAKVTGGWIKSALSETEARAQEAERERRANLEFQTQQTRERADADRASREALAREGIAGRREIAGMVAASRADRATQLKRIPQAAVKSMMDNEGALTRVNEALTSLDKTPDAVGMTNMLGGEWIKNKFWGATADEQLTRAAVADIGSQIIHDRSGAAVTISEAPRLAPFVPSSRDTYQEAKTKLARLKTLLDEESELYRANFGEDQGYQPFVSVRGEGETKEAAKPAGAKPAVAPRQAGETIAQYRARTGGR